MSTVAEKFLIDAEKKVFDPEHRRKLAFNIAQYDKKVVEGEPIWNWQRNLNKHILYEVNLPSM